MFFDSHAHLMLDPVYQNVEGVLQRAQQAKVKRIVNICTDKLSLERGLALKTNSQVLVAHAGATTPHDVEREGEQVFPLFARAAREKQLVAIGETGLDYHYLHSPVATQKDFLRRYLALALEEKLPVIFHCREAFEDLFAITKSEYKVGHRYAPALMHCFTGTMKEAEKALSRGWFLSFSGIVTFKKSTLLREILKEVPLAQLMMETDTPYLAPQKCRGQQNEPSFLPETAEVIAQVKGVSLEEVAEVTRKNACQFFRLH